MLSEWLLGLQRQSMCCISISPVRLQRFIVLRWYVLVSLVINSHFLQRHHEADKSRFAVKCLEDCLMGWPRCLYLFIIFMFLRLSRLQLISSCMLRRNYTRFFRKHSDRIKSCSWDDRSLKCWIAGWSPPSLPITALDFTGSDFTESIIIIYDCKCFFFSSRGLHKRASCEYTKWRRSQTPFLQLQTHRSRFTCCICVMDAGLTFSRWDKVWCRRCSLSLFPPTRRAPKSHITKSTMCRAVCSSKSLHRCYLKKKKKMKTFKFLCTEFFLLILTGGESIWSFKSAPSV